MDIYIKSSDSISAQLSFESGLPSTHETTEEAFYNCIKPEYKKYISPKLLRRMSPIIRNGVACSLSVLNKANLEQPDAIIVGTALGCLRDTTSFLTQLIEENEELPNPTYFIQSTHNTIAGQIALLLTCHSYNFTFSQMHNSFETALLDAQMLMLDEKANNVLVGGVDEMSENTFNLIKDLDCYKNTKPGEGAGFFILSSEESPVKLEGVKIINEPAIDFEKELQQFGLTPEDVDVVIGGDNFADDKAYTDANNLFGNISYVWYKPFMGEFGTVSAIALWMATKVIEEKEIPDCWIKNGVKPDGIANVLVINSVGNEHSLMLLKAK
ncbi:beta-ketoacyl synthase chain length factor [Plebeiibacterium sediminum]|uniref:Beta-ketoacyl synthase chain length factor n=1 Tax=Plebeiibacterium sediminum TaxID=2992112 RepID=A0AAE3M1U7_9BACT|nr:beta-ketoacyl synthase chain length factor [Plebeiobacterium sediminum]MCW3785554.1 beta-ketoacyl synthase chain length factor [Plebeiobacterium sediminum]